MATDKTSAKTTTPKKAPARRTSKKAVEAVDEQVVTEEVVEEKAPEVPSQPVKPVEKRPTFVNYAPNQLIQCRSICPGELVYIGPKTRVMYDWTAPGDVVYMEYQDLMAAVLSKSPYVMKPWFIIEDEELLDDPRWAQVKALYDSMNDVGSVDDILNLSPQKFEAMFYKLPVGIKNAVKAEISARIANGTFDSLKQVRVVDQVCGTDLALLLT